MKATKELRSLWFAAKRKLGTSSYEIASLVHEFLSKAKDKRDFMTFMVLGLQEERGDALNYIAMAHALDVFPDKRDWTRFGWEGIRQLLRIDDDANRAAAVKSLAAIAARSGGSVGPKRIREVVDRFVPRKKPETTPDRFQAPHPATRLAAVREWVKKNASIEGGYLRLRVAISRIPAEVSEALELNPTPEPLATNCKSA